jgi:preprotein translocase subunit SecE
MWFGELFQIGVYKRSQGRITRQVTFAVMAIVFALAAWRLYVTFGPDLSRFSTGLPYGLSAAVLVIGLWVSFRIVNIPRFADFLIAVEAEINKVSWPSRAELTRSAIVVIVVIFLLSTVLFGFDLVWGFTFEYFGILKKGS